MSLSFDCKYHVMCNIEKTAKLIHKSHVMRQETSAKSAAKSRVICAYYIYIYLINTILSSCRKTSSQGETSLCVNFSAFCGGRCRYAVVMMKSGVECANAFTAIVFMGFGVGLASMCFFIQSRLQLAEWLC